MANPLVNELIIRIGRKDFWNATRPERRGAVPRRLPGPRRRRRPPARLRRAGAADAARRRRAAPAPVRRADRAGTLSELLRLDMTVPPTPPAQIKRLGPFAHDAVGRSHAGPGGLPERPAAERRRHRHRRARRRRRQLHQQLRRRRRRRQRAGHHARLPLRPAPLRRPQPPPRRPGRVTMPLHRKAPAIAIVLAIAGALAGGPVRAEPFVPARDDEVLEVLPTPLGSTTRELRGLRGELVARPGHLATASRVARRYLELARASGDPRLLGWAEGALSPWWSEAEPPDDVLRLRASILERRHEFDAALGDLARLIVRRPHDPEAWLGAAMIHQARGEPRAAARSCAPLLGAAPELVAASCLAGAASLAGDAERARGWAARRARCGWRREPRSSARSGSRRLAEAPGQRLRRRGGGRNWCAAALEAAPGAPALLSRYADLLLDTGARRRSWRSYATGRRTTGSCFDSHWPNAVRALRAGGASRFAARPLRGRSLEGRCPAPGRGGPLSARARGRRNGGAPAGRGELRGAARAPRCAHPARGGARGGSARGRRARAGLAPRDGLRDAALAPSSHGWSPSGEAASGLRLLLALLPASAARAHKASDGYLAIERDDAGACGRRLDSRFAISRRRSGSMPTGTARSPGASCALAQARARSYALARLALSADGVRCPTRVVALELDRHSEGRTPSCASLADCPTAARSLGSTMASSSTSTPSTGGSYGSRMRRHASVDLRCRSAHADARARSSGAGSGLARLHTSRRVSTSGAGFDHLLFLCSLLLPAVRPARGSLRRSRRSGRRSARCCVS